MSTHKSFSTETSERYARALFEVVKENNELDKVEGDIKNLSTILNKSYEIKNFINDPTKNLNIQNNVISVLSKKMNFSKNLKSFLFLLIEKRRIFFLLKILNTFLKLCSKKRGELKATLVSSKELSMTDLEKISQELSDTMSSTLKIELKVDKELIGGFKLQLGSFMIDTTIKNKLKKYEQLMLER